MIFHVDSLVGESHKISSLIYQQLESLKVLKRSPDLFNNDKIGQGQLRLTMKHILLDHKRGLQPYLSPKNERYYKN